MGSKPSVSKSSQKLQDDNVKKEVKKEKSEKSVKLDPNSPKDVMISYSHQDKEMMAKIKENLENNGVTVWVDVAGLQAGVDFLGKIGQAILDAKVLISLLSVSTVQSKYCQDEVALAYISQKPILPIAINTQQEIYACMGTGMKLQLVGLEWAFFLEPEKFDENFSKFLPTLKSQLENQESGRKILQRQQSHKDSELAEKIDPVVVENPAKLWEKWYKEETLIEWERFSNDVKKLFKNSLANLCPKPEEEEWLFTNLEREMEVDPEDKMLYKEKYLKFCLLENTHQPLWQSIEGFVREMYAIQMVFAMDSSVRVDAIERLEGNYRTNGLACFSLDLNLIEHVWDMLQTAISSRINQPRSLQERGMALQEEWASIQQNRIWDLILSVRSFQSPKVRESLRDLLHDKSANIRAVAALSLAKTDTDKSTIKQLMKSLNDKDRLVREAGCLALGHLHAQEAVPQLLRLWRNDFISHVREAAQAALNEIGGEEVTQAMHITKVLAEEIRLLTEES